MGQLGKAAGGLAADSPTGAIRPHQVGELRLERRVASAQRVIRAIRDRRCVAFVIGAIMRANSFGQVRQFRRRRFAGELCFTHAALPSRLSAAARAASVIELPASMRAISSRRAVGSSDCTRVAVR